MLSAATGPTVLDSLLGLLGSLRESAAPGFKEEQASGPHEKSVAPTVLVLLASRVAAFFEGLPALRGPGAPVEALVCLHPCSIRARVVIGVEAFAARSRCDPTSVGPRETMCELGVWMVVHRGSSWMW